nr:RNA-directed DNA polymerase, eukaryota [Tanacetum cinerariifolium]
MDIDSIVCPICNAGVETTNHLFFQCNVVRQIMRKISSWWNVDYLDVNSYEEWRAWRRISRKKTKSRPKPDKIRQETESVEKSKVKPDKVKATKSKEIKIEGLNYSKLAFVSLVKYGSPLIDKQTIREGCGGPSDTPLCYLCTCELCENILIDGTCLKCNSGAGNSFHYDPILESFNEVQINSNPLLQSHFSVYFCQICESNSHYGYESSQRVSLVYELEPCYNQNLGDNDYPHDSPSVTPLIDHHCCYKCGDALNDFFVINALASFTGMVLMMCQPMNYFESNPCYDSNYSVLDQTEPPQYSVNPSLNIQNEPDAHELFISKLIQQKLQNEYAQLFSAIAITLDLPTVEPKDSLRMGDEHLDTISATKSDKFIKSSVENLVLNPSKSEDLSDSECDVPVCDDFSTFSNLLFDADDDFSSKFISKNSDAAIESFSPSPILVEDNDSFIEEIDLSFTLDDSMPSAIENDDYDSERDILILEELFSNDSHSLPENESFYFDIPSSPRLPAKPPDDNSKILTIKVVDDISELEHANLGYSISPFLSHLTSSSMGELGQSKRP